MFRQKLNNVFAFVLAAVLTVGLLPIQASAATIAFSDVPANQWYYADVTTLARKGVVSGVGDNKFEPARPVANCEMIKMLVNSFFKSGYQADEAANADAMRAHFGDNLQLYSFMAYYAEKIGLLDGIHVTIESYTDCNQTMSRYNMAQILANVVRIKGMEPTAAQKSAAQDGIKDYSTMPSAYKDAVLTCYAPKTKDANGNDISLLQGADGYFQGNEAMTRAQACAVIVRLDNLIANGTNPVDPGPVVTPDPTPTPTTPVTPTVGDIATSKNAVGAWTVADNKNPDGYLNNGKPITEENVLELLQKAETIWTHGMVWQGSASGNTGNNYANPGSIMYNMLSASTIGSTTSNNPNFGYSGYAAMISDYLFGKSGNNFHKVDSLANVRPGDIIIEVNKNTGAISHVMVALSKSGGTYGQATTAVPGRVYATDGNNGGKVSWPESWDMPFNESNDPTTTFRIFSRYPASAATQPPTPTPTPTPAPVTPEVPTVSNIAVSKNAVNAWTVTDNGNPNRYLNNGKPVTEENVLELLQKAETIWTNNMAWGASGGTSSASYANPSDIMRNVQTAANTGTSINNSANFGCGGYAALISDYIFGKSANNFHRVNNVADIRPGDIIIQVNTTTGKIAHVMIAVSRPGGTYGECMNAKDGFIHVTDGNNGSKVKWPNKYGWGTYEGAIPENTWQVYSRYPA